MEVLRNGKFSLPISAKALSKGLRNNPSNVANVHATTVCDGLVGKDGVLQKIQSMLNTYEISTTFPYPQIFVETNLIIICTSSEIYEFSNNLLSLKITASAVGTTWDLISSHDFIYMSNGIVAITRDPISKEWAESATLPTATAICNYNGQIIIGAPDAGYPV